MTRRVLLLLTALLAGAPAMPALAETPAAPTPAADVATTLRDALHSGEWARVRKLFHDAKSPMLAYLAARWDDVRAGRLDPVAWEVGFDPYRTGPAAMTGQVSVAARLADGTRVGRRFDLAIVQLGAVWLFDEAIAYDRPETRLAAHDLTVDLRREGEIAASDTMSLEATGPDRAVYLRLHPLLRVAEVRVGDATLPFTQHREVVSFERPDGPGPFAVTVRYAGPLTDEGLDFVRPTGSMLRSEYLWYPRPAVGGAFAPYKVAVRVPAEQTAVAVGDREGVEREADAWTYHYKTDRPVEGMTVYAGPYRPVEAAAGSLALEAYLSEEGRGQAPALLAETARVLEFYGARFGRYPERKLALVETDFPGGYGATSAVALPHVAIARPAAADEFLAHELAHNWTDRVAYEGTLGERGFMAEGVASYLDLLYHQSREGVAGFRRRLQAVQRRYAGLMGTKLDVAIADATQDDRGLWQTLTYDKGALVLHMLRGEIGEKAFNDGLRDLYDKRAGQAIGLKDFETSFSKAAHKHMGYFFQQWLERPSVPVIEAEDLRIRAIGKGQYEIDGTLAQRNAPFVLTVPLVVVSDKGEMLYHVPVQRFANPFRLRVSGKPRLLLIDPLHDALLVGSAPIALH